MARLGIWKIHPDGSGAAMLVPGARFLPEVSPDGRYALFVTGRPSENWIGVVEIKSGRIDLFEIAVPGAGPGQAEIPGAGNVGRARWRQDGRLVVAENLPGVEPPVGP